MYLYIPIEESFYSNSSDNSFNSLSKIVILKKLCYPNNMYLTQLVKKFNLNQKFLCKKLGVARS